MAPSPDQQLYFTSTNTVGTSSIMQATRGQCGGGHLLATDCHDPKVLAGRDHSGPLPELTWEQRCSVAGSPCRGSQEKEGPGISGQLGAQAPRRHTPSQPSAFPVAHCKRLSACLPCHHCVPNTEPWPGRKQLSHGHSRGWGWRSWQVRASQTRANTEKSLACHK